jgi:hypothetical protein
MDELGDPKGGSGRNIIHNSYHQGKDVFDNM